MTHIDELFQIIIMGNRNVSVRKLERISAKAARSRVVSIAHFQDVLQYCVQRMISLALWEYLRRPNEDLLVINAQG